MSALKKINYYGFDFNFTPELYFIKNRDSPKYYYYNLLVRNDTDFLFKINEFNFKYPEATENFKIDYLEIIDFILDNDIKMNDDETFAENYFTISDVMTNLSDLYFLDDIFTYGLDFINKIKELPSLLTYSYELNDEMTVEDIYKEDHNDYLINFCISILINFFKKSVNDSGVYTGLYYKDKIAALLKFYTDNINTFIPEENKEFYKKSINNHIKPHYDYILTDVNILKIDRDFLKDNLKIDITDDNYKQASIDYKKKLKIFIKQLADKLLLIK
jgi:hypothetical protein